MKPAPFEYIAPTSLEDAMESLARHGETARVLAGGQSLVPMLNMRLVRPSVLVSLRRIAALQYVAIDDGWIRIGSMTGQRVVEQDSGVRNACPLIGAALGLVGHPAIRNQGTVGGSVAHADPAAELPAVLVALDGTVTLVSTRGRRTVAARAFFRGLMTTAIEPDELIAEVAFPRVGRPGCVSGCAVEEVSRRHGDFALAGAVVALAANADGRIADARIALFGVEARPTRRPQAEAALQGTRCPPEAVADAAALAARDLDPLEDLHASAGLRAQLAGVLARRAIERAYRSVAGDE
jgi:aerobic carbon-monoxide dehydrogenase medium subunit